MDNGVPPVRGSPRAVGSPAADDHGKSLDVLVGSTIFLSAFLLFQVQPILGKAILPRFGGSAAIWTVCLLFFQGVLLAGYLYAHVCVKFLAAAWQRRVHLVLLVAGMAALPITPGRAQAVPAHDDPSVAILITLASGVGLPYFLLAATSPLLQAWITQLRPRAVPYRLFALSNLASLLALLTYPIAVEPFVPLGLQSRAWSAAFVMFALLCGTLAWRWVPGPASHRHCRGRPASPAPGGGTYISWLLLAACPSILLLAITNHLTQDIAPIPFLWIVPLVLYLLSFILCFGERSPYRRALFLPLAAVALVGMDVLLADVHAGPDLRVRLLAPLFALGLFVCCMACHGELARSKPAPDRLTAFYLAVSAGGVLGGVLVAVVAPRVFDDFDELPLAFVLSAACLGWAIWRDRAAHATRDARLALGLAVAIVPMFLAYRVGGRLAQKDPTEVAARNFYGTLRVLETGHGAWAYRSLLNGGVEHGGQFTSAGLRRSPTAYYAPQSGVGRVLLAAQPNLPQKVGVIGLGAGTLAAYARPGDTYVFYEINPLVASIARSRFSYLADAKGSIRLVMGDARVSLEQQAPQGFDLLVVDAFSGDSIPIHLLTAQAFSIYFRHLKPSGVLAVNTTNGYLELDPVVKTIASHFGKESILVENRRAQAGVAAASWVLVAAPGNDLLRKLQEHADADYPGLPGVRLWTDDYSSVVTVVRAWRRAK